ncbi:MAG: hypothetical protein WA871_09525 [Candidatus Acidiferrales bacterium]
MRFARNRYRQCQLLAASFLLAGLAIPGATRAAAQDVGPDVYSPPPAFEFHSGFWVNLHLFLYEQSRLAPGAIPPSGQAAPGQVAVSGQTAAAGQAPTTGQASAVAQANSAAQTLSPAERQTWNAAVAYYAADLGQRDLTASLDFARITDTLGGLETCADLSGRSKQACTSGLRPDVIRVLESAAPIYRAHWWPQQDRANRAWIVQVGQLVQQMGGDMADRLPAIYQQAWPRGRLRVDVVCYAGSEGAYTTLDPPHLMIASEDPRNQGLYGFEVLFHQASEVLAGGVMKEIADLCRQRDIPIPRGLDTALLYYTTGYALEHELAQSRPQNSPYTPYADRFGLYEGAWGEFHMLLDEYWRPYLDGTSEFDSAIEHLVAGIS